MYNYKENKISKQIHGHSPTVDGGNLSHLKEQVALIAVAYSVYDVYALWFEIGVMTIKRRALTFDPNCISCIQRSHLCVIPLAVMGVFFIFFISE